MRSHKAKPIDRAATNVDNAGDCPACGKVRYLTRKQAKLVGRQLSITGVNAYQCGHFWHLGRLPGIVKGGRIPRDKLGQAAKR